MAGVSIGSLYQYFPDKLSLVDAIRRRHLDDCLAVMRKSKTAGLSPVQFVANLIRAMIAARSIYPGLHRVLFDAAPSSGDYRNPNSEFEIEYPGYYAEAVADYRSRQLCTTDQTATLIISDAIDEIIHNAARRGTLGDPIVQSELIRLVSLYLEDARDVSTAK